jgi:N-methylhydantoinase A
LALSIALDIGGTFTDLVVFDDETGSLRHAKSTTTPADLTDGIVSCLKKSGADLRAASAFVHGSTIAINTVIERSGARAALVTTRGTRDVYRVGRANRPEAYNIFFKRPVPLVPRSMTLEVDERLLASGEPLVPLDAAEAEAVARRVAALEPEAVAVCFLHAYANPAHEVAMGAALRAALPEAYVSLSHEILREYREYERTSTTVVNAYIGPRVSRYLSDLERVLAELGFRGTLLIMQSNGGVTSAEVARRVPVALMESGPVGGINASAEVGKALGFANVVAFDMGGTTAKASLIRDGQPAIAEGYYIGGYASGQPVMLPVVDVVEVGAGGGSIAWIDETARLKVGPRSAGGQPGPVCYDAGGTEPTVTDANVVLGRISGERFLGGELPLNVQKAHDAIARQVAAPLGMTVEEAALGIIRIAVAHMTYAVRGVSVERGYDPRECALVVSGGAGPLHALAIARELHIPSVIVPLLPAHFSAVGMLLTDVKHDFVRTYFSLLDDTDFSVVQRICAEMADDGTRLLASEGCRRDAMRVDTFFDLRYVGQEFCMTVPVSAEEIARADRAAIRGRFDGLHDRYYGHHAADEPLELVNVRSAASAARPRIRFPEGGGIAAEGAPTYRAVYVDDPGTPLRCPIYDRASLPAGCIVEGPAIVEEYATTTLLLRGDRASVTPSQELLVAVGGAAC